MSDTPERIESTPERDDLSVRRFDKRVEEWLTSLKDEASERSPEVLSAMASKARELAAYLDNMAEQARAKRSAGTPEGERRTSAR
jgi:hypothetical protein